MGCFFIPLLTLEYLGVGLRKTLPPPLFFGFQKGLGVLRMPQFSREIFLEGWPPPFLKSVNFYPPNHPPGKGGDVYLLYLELWRWLKMIEDGSKKHWSSLWEQEQTKYNTPVVANPQRPDLQERAGRWELAQLAIEHSRAARVEYDSAAYRTVPSHSLAPLDGGDVQSADVCIFSAVPCWLF